MIERSRVRIPAGAGENFLLQGQLSVLTLIPVSVPPRVTSVARKRSRSFCQKCRWQVTAKYACTSRMWLCIKRHGAWLYGVHRTCAETAAVSCGNSHASAVSTPLRWIFKNALLKASHSCRITCERCESGRERRTALDKRSSINQITDTYIVSVLAAVRSAGNSVTV